MQAKKRIQTKDKRNPKKIVELMQTDYPIEIWQYLLHLWANGIVRFGLADRPHVGKGKSRSVLEIRFESSPSTVFCMQYPQGGDGRGFLRKDVKRNRARINGATPKRQTSISKRNDALSKTHRRVSIIAK